MKKYLNKKNLFIVGVIVIILFIFFSSSPTSKRPLITTPITPTPTTITPQLNINQYENTPEWNKIFNESHQKYEKSLNKRTEESLSYIRQNSPIDISGNTISYSYSNATYTITIIIPHLENQNNVLSWLNEREIDQNVIKNLRVNWVQK